MINDPPIVTKNICPFGFSFPFKLTPLLQCSLHLCAHFLRGVKHKKKKMNNTSSGTSSKPKVGSSQPSETSFKRKRGVFQKELQHMMYGFGDDPNPLPESVALMEDIVVEYITELVHKAQDTGSKRGKLSVEDFLYLMRKDLPKLNRCTELLSMNEELKQARRAFETDEEKLRKAFEEDKLDQ